MAEKVTQFAPAHAPVVAAATNLFPSEEDDIETHGCLGAPVGTQELPPFVEE
jgi:hypothetical protein